MDIFKLGDKILALLEMVFGFWNNQISLVFAMLGQSPVDFKGGGPWAAIEAINPIFVAVGSSLVVLFFVIGFCSESVDIKEEMRFEVILTPSVYVAVPVVAPIALGGFYSYNGMGFYEVMGRKIRMMFANHPLIYVSTEGEAMLKECQQAEVAKNITNKKKKGKEVPKTKGNQEEFEAMKKKTKNMLIGVVATMVLAVIGVVIYKARQ